MSRCQNYLFIETNIKNLEYIWWGKWGRAVSCFLFLYFITVGQHVLFCVSFVTYCCIVKIKPKLSSNCDKTPCTII